MSLSFNQKITLDLTVSRVQNIHCSQDDDNSRNILITLSDKGKPYMLSSDESIFLKISKPDNTFIYIDEDDSEHLYRNEDGTISIILSEQATYVPGICEAELQIIDSDKIISTRKFNIIVKKSVVSDKEIESTIETNVIKKMIQHLINFANPHKVTKEQVGLGNVENLSINDQIPIYEEAEKLENISSGEKISTAFGKIKRAITSLIAHINNFDNPHKLTKNQIELGNVNNTSDVDKPVSTAQQKAIDDAYANSNKYTDEKIADLIDGAPETLDTLKEVADAIEKSKTVEEALNSAIGKKANQTELDTHIGNDTIHITSDERTKWNEASDKKHEHSNKSTLDSITSESIEKWNNGSSITGVKGAAETDYKTGNVNITPEDIGLGNVNNTADSEKSVKHAGSAGAVEWGNVSGKPSEFPPSTHTHDYIPLSGGTITGNISTNGGATFTTDGNVYLNSNGYKDWLTNILNSKLSTSASCNKNWHWDGSKGNQPTWLWGGELPNDVYVYNPSNFSVNYANSAGSTGKLVCGGYGTSTIGDGGGDRALGVGDLLNNLAISSWYGVSFTTSCSGQLYTNRNAFSIDCRNGIAYGHIMDVNEYIVLSNNKYLKTKNNSGATYNLIGINSVNNLHIGDHNNSESGIYVHTRGGKQYNFTDAAFCPNVKNNVPLGLSDKLWKVVYAKTGTINTSDRTKKHDIKDLSEVYEKLFLNLQPKSFIFNDGDRVHIGAISQDVEDSMKELGLTAKEFAGFCKDIRYEYTKYNNDGTPVESSKVPCKDENGNIIYDYALRYQEFIFLTVHMVQKLWNRVEILEKENAEMKEQIKSMQQDIAELKKSRT